MGIKRVCVFCGSSTTTLPKYLELAKRLGHELGKRQMELVYGGGCTGLMGAVADATLEAGGTVYGVIPTFLKKAEVVHTGLTELHEVKSMHQRKALMEQRAEAFLTLPGGFGTLDETFEIITWLQLGLHQKPVFLLNEDGFYDHLLRFLEVSRDANLLRPQHLAMLQEVRSLEAFFSVLGNRE